jgi:hypothetical protein
MKERLTGSQPNVRLDPHEIPLRGDLPPEPPVLVPWGWIVYGALLLGGLWGLGVVVQEFLEGLPR